MGECSLPRVFCKTGPLVPGRLGAAGLSYQTSFIT